ncbi:MAG: hypothetical protein NTW14_13280 [bacterium]|nr:hypothetical protein [bacterium]
MKYLIDSKRPLDEEIDVERELTHRLDIANQIKNRFRTDVHYFYADRVGMIFIVDLDNAEQLAEIVLLLRRAELCPMIYPLITAPAMADVITDVAQMT